MRSSEIRRVYGKADAFIRRCLNVIIERELDGQETKTSDLIRYRGIGRGTIRAFVDFCILNNLELRDDLTVLMGCDHKNAEETDSELGLYFCHTCKEMLRRAWRWERVQSDFSCYKIQENKQNAPRFREALNKYELLKQKEKLEAVDETI